MNRPESSVSEIPGVGRVTLKRLQNESIHTIKDLLSYKHEIPGLNIKKVKELARRSLTRDTRINKHTWFNHVAHIIRGKNTIRVLLKDIIIGKHSIGIEVHWYSGSVCKKRVVSLCHIIAVHNAWLSADLVSDDSDTDEECENNSSNLPAPTKVSTTTTTVPRLVGTLPKLLVSPSDVVLDKYMTSALSRTVKDVNTLNTFL